MRRTPAYWRNRRVTIVGLQRSGLAAAERLRAWGARLSLTDAAATPELRRQVEALAARAGRPLEQWELGGHTRSLIAGRDVIVVSPGVPEEAPPLVWARAAKIPMVSELEVGLSGCRAPVVAVTGTNGKTTVTTLVGRILQTAGRHALVCGNIGTPLCAVLPDVTPASWIVLEVSSFQLLHTPSIHPWLAVILNLSDNHLDRHRSFQAYREVKARLLAHQTSRDWALLNAGDVYVRRFARRTRARVAWFNDPPMRTAHRGGMTNPNFEAVCAAARLLRVPAATARQVVERFTGLPHRLEHVETIRGVQFINDSKSTTPASLRWAIEQTPGPLIVLGGGRNKGADFRPLRPVFQAAVSRVKRCIVFGESGGTLRRAWRGAVPLTQAGTLEDAVAEAIRQADDGDTVLLSPGCASFDQFRNYEERGERFKQLVRQLYMHGATLVVSG